MNRFKHLNIKYPNLGSTLANAFISSRNDYQVWACARFHYRQTGDERPLNALTGKMFANGEWEDDFEAIKGEAVQFLYPENSG